MKYKPDADLCKKRHEAVWECEIIDRCCVAVPAPKRVIPAADKPDSPEEWKKYWTDEEAIYKRYIKSFDNTYFAGDALPIMNFSHGPAAHAGFFKDAKYSFDSTVWFSPSLTGEKYADSLEFSPESELYQMFLKTAQALADKNNGDYILSMPDCAGILDALAHLRGTEDLLCDMALDEGEQIKSCLSKIKRAWYDFTQKMFDIIGPSNNGGYSIGWLGTWASGTHTQLQCDISVMLSPEYFSEYAIDEINELSGYIKYPLYHIDGYEQIRHLDKILSVDAVRMYQWTAVEGQPSPVEFIPWLQKIQKAGKSLVLKIKKRDFKPLMENLSSKGLYIYVVDAKDPQEADEIVKLAERLTRE